MFLIWAVTYNLVIWHTNDKIFLNIWPIPSLGLGSALWKGGRTAKCMSADWSNGVTGCWRFVPGSQVRLYPVGYPVLLYLQTHVKMRNFYLKTAILGTQKAKIGGEIVPGQSTWRIFQWNCTRSGTQKYPVTPLDWRADWDLGAQRLFESGERRYEFDIIGRRPFPV
jgi:hypothetical protein